MGNDRPSRARGWPILCALIAPALALAAAFAGCDPTEAPVGTSLVVLVANQQPSAQGSGVTTVIQSTGGARLRIRTVGGLHRLTPDETAHATSCLAVPPQPIYLSVFPEDDEALLYVDLLPALDAGSPDAGDGGLEQACPGEPLLYRIVPISHPKPTIATDAAIEDASGPVDDGGAGDAADDVADAEGGG